MPSPMRPESAVLRAGGRTYASSVHQTKLLSPATAATAADASSARAQCTSAASGLSCAVVPVLPGSPAVNLPLAHCRRSHYTLARARCIAWMLTPVWVFDLTVPTILWANAAALELWEARDLAELQARDFPISPTRRASAWPARWPKSATGAPVPSSGPFYPEGAARVQSDRQPDRHRALRRPADDAARGRPVVPEQPDPLALRGIEAPRTRR